MTIFAEKLVHFIGMVTFDYGSPKSKRLLERIVGIDAIPALGHDVTRDFEAIEAFGSGVRHLTHAYSCSSSFVDIWSVPLQDAVACTSANPARILGVGDEPYDSRKAPAPISYSSMRATTL